MQFPTKKNPLKGSPNRTKTEKGAWHPTRPFGTLGVPIGPNAWPGPRIVNKVY